MRGAILAAIAALATATGCGTFLSFEAEAPNACATVTGVHITGADEYPLPVNSLPTSTTVTETYTVPLDGTGISLDSGTDLKFVSFTLKPESASYDFSFVTDLQLSALHAGAALPLGEYTPGSGTATSIVIQPSPEPDVTGYVSSSTLVLQGVLTGSVPAHGFDADASICFDATFSQITDSSATKVE